MSGLAIRQPSHRYGRKVSGLWLSDDRGIHRGQDRAHFRSGSPTFIRRASPMVVWRTTRLRRLLRSRLLLLGLPARDPTHDGIQSRIGPNSGMESDINARLKNPGALNIGDSNRSLLSDEVDVLPRRSIIRSPEFGALRPGFFAGATWHSSVRHLVSVKPRQLA